MVDLKRRGFFAAAAVPVAALPVAAAPVVQMHEADVAMVHRVPVHWLQYKAEFIRQFEQRALAIYPGGVTAIVHDVNGYIIGRNI